MKLIDIVSKIRTGERVSVISDEVIIDCMDVERLRLSNYFKKELADREVVNLGVGLFCEVNIFVEE